MRHTLECSKKGKRKKGKVKIKMLQKNNDFSKIASVNLGYEVRSFNEFYDF